MIHRLKILDLMIIAIIGIIALLTDLSCTKNEMQEEKPSVSEILVVDKISSLEVSDLYNVSDLTITGSIDGDDWNLLYEISMYGNLKKLDIGKVSITGDYTNPDSWKDDEIPAYIFSGNKTLEEVILPMSLKSIGQEAFANCKNLKSIKFGDSIDSIASRAFFSTPLQGELTIPANIRIIGKQAFAETDISKVSISSDIHTTKESTIYTVYSNSVFANCSNLQEVIVAEGCTILELGFSNCKKLNTVSLPSSLQKIGYESSISHNYIFNQCSRLENIKLPQALVFIGEYTFSRTPLRTINIPNSVQHIGNNAFYNCEMLEEISIPDNLTKLEYSCFEGCSSLTTIQLPESIAYIDSNVFKDCISLKNISLGGNIVTIGDNAFSNCSSLLSVKLTNNVESLGKFSFENCSALTDVILNDKLTILQASTFKGCTNLHNITLGNAIETIENNCFYNCLNLSKIEIPYSVQSFSDYTFAYSGLQEIKVHWTIPIQILENVFTGLNLNKMHLSVPHGTKHAYSQSNIWNKFGDIHEDE